MASLTIPAQTASRTHLITAGFLALAMAATVVTALGFQHIGGYIPCKLCYEQRIPYYIGAPLMAVALLAALFKVPSPVTRLLLLAGAVLMAWSLYLGIHHAGIEWGFWAGPTDCAVVVPPASGGSGGVLDQIDQVVPPSCDKASLRVLGLSFAGWNAVASLVLMLVALRGAAKSA
jgi:disulfide bond formation protein DsbB